MQKKEKPKVSPPNPHRICQMREDGWNNIREFFTPPKGNREAHLTLKCGDCDEKVKVYFGSDTMEINGVFGSVKNWKEIFHKIVKKTKEQEWDKITW
jgi:hypothetical protein